LAPHGPRLQQPHQAEHDHPKQDHDERVSLSDPEEVRPEQDDEFVGEPYQGAGDDQPLPAAEAVNMSIRASVLLRTAIRGTAGATAASTVAQLGPPVALGTVTGAGGRAGAGREPSPTPAGRWWPW
jgi:hypothetical protein